MSNVPMISMIKMQGFLKLALLFNLIFMLVACSTGEQADAEAVPDGMASIQISIPGLQPEARAMEKRASREGVPAELTSLLIEVINSQQRLLASAEVIGSDGNVSLTVPAGNNYTIRGSGYAAGELVFSGQTQLEKIELGSRTSVSLTLLEQVSLVLTSPGDIAAGSATIAISYNLMGLNNSSITWYVNDSAGGSVEFGTIDTNGLYSPPATAPANTLITIKAEPLVTPSFAQSFSFNLLPATNTAPEANAGADQSVFELSIVTLDGSASSDNEAAIAHYFWVQTAGPAVMLSRNDTAQVNFTAPALDDGMTQSYQFSLTVTDDSGLTAVDIVQIQVDDLPNVSIVNNSVPEGDTTTTLGFSVTLEALSGDVELQYATQDGTASSGSDYIAASGSVVFSAGALTQTISVTINGDIDVEADETLLLDLFALSGAAEFSNASAVGTILNDDVATQPTVDISLQASGYDPNALNPFTLTIAFPEPVTGFDATDIVLTIATLSNLSSSDNRVYTAVIQPIINGTVRINIPADRVVYASGDSNNAARELRLPFFDWSLRHPTPTTADLESVASGGGRCVIGGSGGNLSEILISSSYLFWQRSPLKPADPSVLNIRDVTYTQVGGGLYLATGKDGFYSSLDASSWTFNATVNSLSGEEFYAIAEGVGGDSLPLLLAAGRSNNQMSISRDGLSWTDQDYSAVLQSSEFVNLNDVTWDGSRFIAVGHRFQFFSFSNNNNGSIILTSPDGVNWSSAYRSFVDTSGFSNATYDFLLSITLGEDGNGNPRWLAMGNKGVVVTSSDGVSWSAVATTLGDSVKIESVKWSGSEFIAVGSDSSTPLSHAVMYRSGNGLDWTAVALPVAATVEGTGLKDIALCPGQGSFGQDVWLAVGKKGAILSSANTLSWSLDGTQQFGGTITDYVEGGLLKLAQTQSSSAKRLYRSTNGFDWGAGFSEEVVDLSFFNTEFYAITRDTDAGNWALKASSDGLSWTERVNVSSIFPYPEALLKVSTASGADLWALGAASDSNIHLSADGVNWSSQVLATPLATAPVADSRGSRLIASTNNQLVSSENGIDWAAFGVPFCDPSCPFPSLKQVLQLGDRYLAWGDNFAGEGVSNRRIIYSDDDGQSWSVASPLPGSCFDAPTLSVVADVLSFSCGQLYVSVDGVEWVEMLAPFNEAQLKYTRGRYWMFGGRGGLMIDRLPPL